MSERYLVTGALGCLGAWVARAVLDDGNDVVGYDLGESEARLDLVLGEAAGRVILVRGDITDLDALERVLDDQEITRVVHLAALQVPFVRANPPLGMRVNVAGTVNVFEAVSRRLDRIPGVAYAARPPSTARRTPRRPPRRAVPLRQRSTACRSSPTRACARVRADTGVPSIGLRPYVVYGPGRDQGMTSGPTMAMLAAVRGEPYHIGFSGSAQFDFVPDVARAALTARHGNRDGPPSTTSRAHPPRSPTWSHSSTRPSPAPRSPGAAIRCRSLRRWKPSGSTATSGAFPRTSLADGIAATVAHFRRS